MRRYFPALLVAIFVICAGCQSGTQLMPTPNLYARGEANPFADVPPALQGNHVEVLYLTDRKPETPEKGASGSAQYGYGRSRSVAFGVSDVEIGKDVSWEQLVAASRTGKRAADLPLRVVSTKEIVRFPETPRILMDMPSNQSPVTPPTTSAAELREEVSEDLHRCHQEITARLAKTPDKEVYVFVHGYDNTFDDSVVTIAQIWHFLGRRGVPVAYSWPAGGRGLLRGYEYDFQSSEFTVYHLKEMIRDIAKCSEVQKIHIICHSRGTGVVVSALAQLHLEISGSGRSTREVLKMGTLVMAAPDIDFDVLIQQAVTVRLGQMPEHTALYVCSKDKALSLSSWLAGGIVRAGEMQSSMFSPDELEMLQEAKTVQIIDCRITDPGPFGHSYFHANPAVSSDLMLLLRYQLSPGPETGRPLGHDKSGFWFITDGYPGPATQPAAQVTQKPGGA